ncbi:hypothetical protein OC835_006384 [Tilletia horrida]|nr:hypothetical protein OC835_006384 [Tilletia horrida]
MQLLQSLELVFAVFAVLQMAHARPVPVLPQIADSEVALSTSKMDAAAASAGSEGHDVPSARHIEGAGKADEEDTILRRFTFENIEVHIPTNQADIGNAHTRDSVTFKQGERLEGEEVAARELFLDDKALEGELALLRRNTPAPPNSNAQSQPWVQPKPQPQPQPAGRNPGSTSTSTAARSILPIGIPGGQAQPKGSSFEMGGFSVPLPWPRLGGSGTDTGTAGRSDPKAVGKERGMSVSKGHPLRITEVFGWDPNWYGEAWTRRAMPTHASPTSA